jgi:hypothetical protein
MGRLVSVRLLPEPRRTEYPKQSDQCGHNDAEAEEPPIGSGRQRERDGKGPQGDDECESEVKS